MPNDIDLSQVKWDTEQDIDLSKVVWDKPILKESTLPNKEIVESRIASRENPYETLKEELTYIPNLKEHPIKGMVDLALKPYVTLPKIAAIPVKGAEAALANYGMAIQRGEPDTNIRTQEFMKGLTGEKIGEFGDIIRTTGFGGKLNEPLAVGTGLLTSYGLYNLASKGSIAPALKGKNPIQIQRQAQKELSDTFNFIKNIPEFSKQAISKIRDYAGNKVDAIRQGSKTYWRQEVDAYGKSIESLSQHKQDIKLSPLMENMTKQMIDRGLYDPINEKWVTPLNKVDAQFVKSYTSLARNFTKTGKANISDIIREYQNIKNAVPLDSSRIRDARTLANSLIHSIGDQININTFKEANTRYATFRNNFDQIDRMVGVWENPLKTGSAEKFLTRRLGETREARKTAQIITEKTGQTLKGAKVLSAIQRVPGVKWLK